MFRSSTNSRILCRGLLARDLLLELPVAYALFKMPNSVSSLSELAVADFALKGSLFEVNTNVVDNVAPLRVLEAALPADEHLVVPARDIV